MKATKVKMLHFIRHGQSTYNAAVHERNNQTSANLNSRYFVDAPLSEKGQQQALILKQRLHDLKPEIAITSPYRRTIDTCLASCGNVDLSVTPLCGERLDSICDVGSSPRQLQELYASISNDSLDFSALGEVWWHKRENFENGSNRDAFIDDFVNTGGERVRESYDELYKRAEKFYNYLLTRQEQCIVIFSHHCFLRNFLHWHFGREQGSPIQNCEILSYSLPFKIEG